MLDCVPVDRSGGLGSADLDELVERMLLMIQSFIIDPGTPGCTSASARRVPTRWLAPAVKAAIPT